MISSRDSKDSVPENGLHIPLAICFFGYHLDGWPLGGLLHNLEEGPAYKIILVKQFDFELILLVMNKHLPLTVIRPANLLFRRPGFKTIYL